MMAAWLLFSASLPALTLDDLQQRLAQHRVIRSDFTQLRQIAGMSRPLRSSGRLLISQADGLWWQQDTPFPMTLILTEQQMVQQMPNQPPQVITAVNQPQMFQFNHLLRALFQADRQVLMQNFSLALEEPGTPAWRLVLTPNTSPLDKLFTHLILEGDQLIDHIALYDRQGDVTTLAFTHQRLLPGTLSDDEQQRFRH